MNIFKLDEKEAGKIAPPSKNNVVVKKDLPNLDDWSN